MEPLSKPASKPASGFTLLEVLVALTISTALVLLGLSIFRTVGQATMRASTSGRDWTTELFLRRQLAEADFTLSQRFALVRTEADRFSFVSRRSAQFGELGPPALVTWWFDAATRNLRYRETMLPAWWAGDAARGLSYDEITSDSSLPGFECVIFSDVSLPHFRYWNAGLRTWDRDSADYSTMPERIRLELTRTQGPERYVFETRKGSFSFSSSGSSPAAP